MSSEMMELVNKVEVDVALGKLSAAATFTKMRELLNLAATQGTDGCTETSCERCATAPHARGEMRHAGIGSYPALLARTEAAPVADGELPGMWSASDFTGGDPDERSYSERAAVGEVIVYDSYRGATLYGAESCALAAGTKLYTHPHDASGDAVTGRVNGYMFSARAIEIITDGEVPEWITKAPGLRVTITAMQAKEAK